MTAGGRTNFDSYSKIALNLERGVWHLLAIVFKKSCYFCSDSGKARQAKQCNLLLCEPGNHSLCKFNIFTIFRGCACLAKIHLHVGYGCFSPVYEITK